MLRRHSRAALAALPLILVLAAPAVAGTIIVTHHGPSSATTCTLAQAIDAANRANNGSSSYGATPAGATTVDPLRYSVTREIGSGSCSGATAGANTISLQNFAGQELLFDPTAGLYPDQGWNGAVRDRADNYWYGPNALPPIASEIIIEGATATLRIPGGVRRLRFFFVGADPSANNLNYFFEPITPGYNTPGAGKLTLRKLSLRGGRQRGGQAQDVGGGAGLGGAIFNQGKLVLQSVTLHENTAIGGQYPGGYDADAAPGGIGGGDPGPGGAIRRAGGMGGPVPGGTRDAGHAGNDSSCLDCAGGKDNGLGGDAYALLGGGEFGGRAGNGGGGGHWTTEGTAYSSGGGGGGGFGGGPGGTPSQGRNVAGSFGLGGGGNCVGGGIGASGSPACGGTIAAGGGFGGGGGFAFGSTSRGGFGGGSGLVVGGSGTPGFGGGGSNVDSGGGGAGLGGAVFNHFGSVDIYNSTLARNQALGSTNSSGYFGGSGLGGAVFNLNGTLSIRYSTLAENRVAGENADGGAVYSLGYNADPSALNDPAFTGSHIALVWLDGAVLADSLWVSPDGDVDANDIVIDRPALVANGAANQATSLLQNRTNQTQNLIERKLAAAGGAIEPNSWLSADPQLGPLADNGGRLLTKAPAAGSPVIDGQIGNLCTGVTNDQRGVQRPIGAACDLGAVEDEGTLLVTSSGNSDTTDGLCTLREAIDNANTASQPRPDCATGNSVRNRVRFAPNVSTITVGGYPLEFYSFPTDVNGDRNGDGLPDVTIDAAGSSRHFVLNNGSDVSLRGLRLINGRASVTSGGAIAVDSGRLSLSDCIMENNTAGDGGAIRTLVGTQLELRHCLLRDNIAFGSGGAILGAGTLAIETSSFINNEAGSASGGALRISGTASIVNSTLQGNYAFNGGALQVTGSASATLRYVTVVGNQGANGAGLHNLGSLSLGRSIIANNYGSNCSGSVTDAGDNLAWGDASCGATVAQADPRLLPLADNGGGTPTLMPDTGSAAIDRIDCTAEFPTDQRGVTRPQGLRCDPGAVEATPFADRIFAAGFE